MSGEAQGPDAARIGEIERRLDRMFHNQVPDHEFVRSLDAALHEWSHAILAAAESLGASPPSESALQRGLELARRPVFVCGLARSGTTLLRDLLDGHPELVVIPVETSFYTGMERPLMHLRGDLHRAYFARRWLERMAHAPPCWLLASSEPGSPDVTFARDFAGWWQVPQRHKVSGIPAWPLMAFALAYAQRLGRGQLPAGARMWVEKTPGHLRCLKRIWADFPAARVIQIVRQPEAVLASVKASAKRMPPHRVSRSRTAAYVLRDMAPAYRIAANAERRLDEGRHCLVRYEDLTADPGAVMRRIAGFLEIENGPSLIQPTVAGRPAALNSSFGASRPDLSEVLDPLDRALLALAVARSAAELGYSAMDPGPAAEHAIVGSPA